jgi:hypothetical protein
VGNRPADVACLHPIKADPLPSVTHGPRQFGAAHTPLPPSQQLLMACHATCFSAYMLQPRPFQHSSSRATPTRSQGAHLKEETKMNNSLLHSSLIRVLGAEQSAPKDRRKFPEYSRPQIFGLKADILAGRAGTTAGTVRQRRRPYKLGSLGADPT